MRVANASAFALRETTIETWNVTDASTVNAGNVKTVTIRAPSGYEYELMFMRLRVEAPPGASSGYHGFFVYLVADRYFMWGRSVYSSVCEWDRFEWVKADFDQNPSDLGAQAVACSQLKATYSKPIYIAYENSTNADQTLARTINALVRKRRT